MFYGLTELDNTYKIQPPRGISIGNDGTVTLTAYRTNNSGERIPKSKRNCAV